MLAPAASTPSNACSMPRSAMEASRRASTAGFLIRWLSYLRSNAESSRLRVISALRTVLLQLGHNIVHPAAARHAVLSHRPQQHLENLGSAHTPALDQSRHHRHIAHYAGREFQGCRKIGIGAHSALG